MLKEAKAIAQEITNVTKIQTSNSKVKFPHTDGNKNLATRENLEALMSHVNIDVRYDVIKKRLVVEGLICSDGDAENLVIAHLKSKCAIYGLSKQVVEEQLSAITKDREFNPVTDWLGSLQRTKHTDPIKELVDSLPVQNKKWVYVAFKRWLIQCVAAADACKLCGNKHALPKYESILTFYGAQGTKKSSFIRALLPTEIQPYFMDGHLLDLSNKDSIFQALQNWIVEFGELDSTFRKSDISAIKAFASRGEDVMRLPYAKAPTRMPRQTSFLGSVNEEKYLRDTTGNRRYFPITVLGELIIPENFDCNDLWAHIWELYLMGEQWWLTPDEEVIQRKALSGHQHLDYEELLIDCFDFDSPYRENRLTSLEILGILNLHNSKSESTRLGITLKSMDVERLADRRYAMPKQRL